MLCVTLLPMEQKKETEAVRISKNLTKMLRSLAVHYDLSMPEYLEQLLAGIVEEQYARMVEVQQKTVEEMLKKKGKPDGSTDEVRDNRRRAPGS